MKEYPLMVLASSIIQTMSYVFWDEEIEFAIDELLEMPELDEIAFLNCEKGAIVDHCQLAP